MLCPQLATATKRGESEPGATQRRECPRVHHARLPGPAAGPRPLPLHVIALRLVCVVLVPYAWVPGMNRTVP